MGKRSAPKAPDPIATAGAQTGTNISSAIANQRLNMIDQVGPQGSTSFMQTGSTRVTDPTTGETYDIPKYRQSTTLNGTLQAAETENQKTQLKLARLGNDQARRISGVLSNNLNTNGLSRRATADDLPGTGDLEADRSRVEQAMFRRLLPQIGRDREGLESRLANQGIRVGSEAYGSAMDDFSRGVTDARLAVVGQGGQEMSRRLSDGVARSNMLNTNRARDFQERMTVRNAPLNEISALLSGSQVAQPSAAATPQVSLPTTDVAGLINSGYTNQLNSYNQSQANRGGLFGGLLQLGGTLGGAGIAAGLFR